MSSEIPSTSVSLEESQASPIPSISASAWSGFGIEGQLSPGFGIPSESISKSQASPSPSPSVSS